MQMLGGPTACQYLSWDSQRSLCCRGGGRLGKLGSSPLAMMCRADCRSGDTEDLACSSGRLLSELHNAEPILFKVLRPYAATPCRNRLGMCPLSIEQLCPCISMEFSIRVGIGYPAQHDGTNVSDPLQVGELGNSYVQWVHRPAPGQPRFFRSPVIEYLTKTPW